MATNGSGGAAGRGLVDRAKAILVSPKTEWPVIDAERSDVGSIYRDYAAWLAAIPAIATLIGFSAIGMAGWRVPFGAGLLNAIVGWAMTLVMFYVMALIVDALAPTFGGRRDRVAALKLVVYGSTASMVAGIVYVLPMLSVIALLGTIYSVYLIWLGLPVLMKCPKDRALAYMAVLVVAGLVVGLLMGFVSALFIPAMMPHEGMPGMTGDAPVGPPGTPPAAR